MGCIGENLNQVFPADPGYQNTSPRVGIKVGAGVRVFLFDFKSVQCYNIPIMSMVEGTCIERQTGIPRFSGETVRDLKGRGFRIYELTAQTWESFPKNYNHVLISPLSLQASLYSPKHS